MNDYLFSWIGFADLKASKGESVGLGPIAQAVTSREYRSIYLLCDCSTPDREIFQNWLANQTDCEIILKNVRLPGPTDFGAIHQATTDLLDETIPTLPIEHKLTFHLSPGTPAMSAVWIILGKTRFPAELIESSKAHGVRTVSIPFDISADYTPDLFKKHDQTLKRLAAGLPSSAPEFDDIIHRSEVMQRVVLMARRVAPRSIPVLIEGESGTGKELFARAIHKASPRRDKPFITINCGAIPAELVEAELFGYEKGAFTGAAGVRIGHFETADQGTMFLDEIGELPKDMQVKLLRTLQEGEVKRIGATKPIKVDIRVIAATNKTLIEEVAANTFREDLFYRLAVAVLKLPPLRKRVGDVSLLIDRFLSQINDVSSKEPGFEHKIISASARNILLQHSWPGNIRELQNTLTRAMIWSADEEIGEADVQDALLPIPRPEKAQAEILNQSLDEDINLPEIMDQVAIHYLKRGLVKKSGNKTQVAKLLGISNYQTLSNWLKKYGLE
ncbi:MAG: AAA family ATPase [Desulfobulbaceae bacterium]|nr:MAG: AAA family ATPase [Desulfobulbaceae bacterium]